jgi:hypothetical protein
MEAMQDSHAMPNSNNGSLAKSLGVTMTVSVPNATTGNTIQVLIKSEATIINSFKGLLLYAEGESGKYSAGWTYDSDYANPSCCNNGPGLGHNSPAKKLFPSTFLWKVPGSDEFNSSTFTFKGVVVVDKTRWGVLNEVKVSVTQVH